MTPSPARLDEYDREEWRDAVRRLRPDLDDAEIDRKWHEFQRLKQQRTLQ